MPRLEYKTCKNCGRHVSECGVLSHTRLCERCGLERMEAWNDQLHFHNGPTMLVWRRKIAASVGAVLLDDLESLAR